MADQNKGKQFYELTREKPYGLFHMILVGGTACAVLAFLIVSLVGTYEGLAMDSIILGFLAAVLLGFLVGGLLTWLAIQYISPIVERMDHEKEIPVPETTINESVGPLEGPSPSEESEDKGQSVDFVFPEISPDQQS